MSSEWGWSLRVGPDGSRVPTWGGWRIGVAGAWPRIGRRPSAAPAARVTRADVVVVTLGRGAAMGERRRVASWVRIAGEGGLTAMEVPLLQHCRSTIPTLGQVWAVLRGASVPETLAWSPRRLDRILAAHPRRAVIYVTTRAFPPGPTPSGTPVFDFVDQLSLSYRDRSAIADRRRGRLAYRVLAASHARAERRVRPATGRRVAAGLADAAALHAEYLPIVVEPGSTADTRPDVDVLFIGTLTYPPNQAALRVLARQWPAILDARPATTALIAGAHPPDEVRALATRLGWELVADFPDASAVYARARVAVAPLNHAAGIQIKVIDAAGQGLAQVVFAPATAGLPAGFPAVVADEATFAGEVVGLLDDDDRRNRLGREARRWTDEHLAPAVWAPWLRDVATPTV